MPRSPGPAKTTIGVLGPLEVRQLGRRVDLPPAQRRLLCILVTELGRPIGTGPLIDRMWPQQPPPTVRTALHVHVCRLRKAVPIVSEPHGYRLAEDAVDVDLAELECLTAEAAQARASGQWADALGLSSRARQLERGAPLAELAGDPAAETTIARVAELVLVAAVVEVEALLALKLPKVASGRLVPLAARYPFNDELCHLRMVALYRSGRQVEALTSFHSYRRLLRERLGIAPDPRLTDLEQRILRHDAELNRAGAAW